MSNFEHQSRYYALSGMAAGLLEQEQLSLGEYYQVLSALSQKYLTGVIAHQTGDETREEAEM